MSLRTLLGLFIILIVYSCAQVGLEEINSGLLIHNGINRGLGYTDSIKTKYNVRYIPITITNDSSIQIHIQIAFLKEYHFPIVHDTGKFKVFLIPKEMHPDNITYDSVSYELGQNELRNYFDRELNQPDTISKTLNPGEKFVTAIGTLYPMSRENSVLPNAIFVQCDSDNFQVCDNILNQEKLTDSHLSLSLKLDFNRGEPNESCIIIPCGQISYLED